MGLIGQETTGAVGFAKALRTIPAMLDIARDVAELAPRSWIINYTNPTGLVTEAVLGNSEANIAGLCSGGLSAQIWAANALNVSPGDVRYDFAGLNHMNFSYNITVKGKPITDKEFELVAGHVGSIDKSLILKLGALPSSYLQYYFHRNKMLGEQTGAAKTRGETVVELENGILGDLSEINAYEKPESLKKRGGGGYAETAVMVMEALYNNRDTWAVVNTANNGVLPFLPNEAVIETPCLVNATGIMPLTQAPPPKAVWGLIAAVKNYESLAVEAAVTGNRDAALLALLAHPLIGDYEKAKEALDILLELNKGYLPQFIF
jgi:6-phospho-beta-glucosidase